MTDDLSTLLHDAVADVEPDDRLDEIRARTASPSRSAARPWFYAAGATVLATAATVAAFAVLGDDGADEAGPSHHAHDPQTQLVAAYYVGDTPYGPRLFREFDQAPAGDPLDAALDRIQRPATDPDYSTPWDADSFTGATVDEGVITVHIGSIDPSVDASQLGVQQVIYTLQGALGERLPVRFVEDNGFVYLGPMDAATQTDVLSLVSVSDPAQGNEYQGSFMARGVANSFEATVPWEIRGEGPRGGVILKRGSAMASAAEGDRLYPWETTIDISDLAPGTYTFVAKTDDPTGEGPGPYTDTRTIVVR